MSQMPARLSRPRSLQLRRAGAATTMPCWWRVVDRELLKAQRRRTRRRSRWNCWCCYLAMHLRGVLGVRQALERNIRVGCFMYTTDVEMHAVPGDVSELYRCGHFHMTAGGMLTISKTSHLEILDMSPRIQSRIRPLNIGVVFTPQREQWNGKQAGASRIARRFFIERDPTSHVLLCRTKPSLSKSISPSGLWTARSIAHLVGVEC